MTHHGLPLKERFMLHVQPEPNTGCWLWDGADDGQRGYGRFQMGGLHRTRSAHRASYEIFKGPIPAGLTLDHKCRTPACVNPDHLEPVTALENLRRGNYRKGLARGGEANGGRQRARTHCKRGHPFDVANTYVVETAKGTPGRQCRRCHADRENARRLSSEEGSSHTV